MKEFRRVLVAVYFFLKYVNANEGGLPCGQEELIQCSKQIRALTATSEFNFVDNKEELDRICPDLHTGLECIRSYTRRCMSQHEREHFNKIYAGTNEMIRDLCSEGQYQEDFLRYAPCMRKVRKEYEMCANTYKNIMLKIHERKNVEVSTTTIPTTILPTTTASFRRAEASLMKRQQSPSSQSSYVSLETTTINPVKNSSSVAVDQGEEQIKTVCCAFQEYMRCSERAVKTACGAETAEFTRNFLDKMLSTLIRLHCDEPEMRQCEEYSSAHRTMSTHVNFMLISGLVAFVILLF